MSHRDEFTPGDMSARISFPRTMGTGPNSGKVHATLEVTDEVSGGTIRLDLTPEQLTDMLSGSAAEVSASKVSGYAGVRNWGRYQKVTSRVVSVERDDHKAAEAASLPHVAKVIAELEADGFKVDPVRRNNAGQYVIFGRRYDDLPD
jgi:hypothetical protein